MTPGQSTSDPHIRNLVEDLELSVLDDARGRLCWPRIWMSLAHSIAMRSYDSRSKVGTVIISSDNTQVLAIGYNGDQMGGPNRPDSQEPGQSGLIHSEINALLKLDYHNPTDKVAYVTLSPCRTCARALVNAKIKKVVYDVAYRDPSGIQILKDSGLTVVSFFDELKNVK